jgi:hypothetical protein
VAEGRLSDPCRCSTCVSLDRLFPREGTQLALLPTSSGGAPVCASLTDPDAPPVPAGRVSAPEGRSSRHALAAVQPETVSL